MLLIQEGKKPVEEERKSQKAARKRTTKDRKAEKVRKILIKKKRKLLKEQMKMDATSRGQACRRGLHLRRTSKGMLRCVIIKWREDRCYPQRPK